MTMTPYTLADDLGDLRVGVLVHALSGGMDAGRASSLVARHLTGSLSSRRVATFAADEFVDYRAHRPAMVFSESRWTDYAEPTIALDLLRDDEGTGVLLLHGPEPDLRWSAFVQAVLDLVETFDVQLTVGVQGIPMAVPHTRPTTVTPHATRADLVSTPSQIQGTLQVPGSASALLEYTLGRAGHDAIGFAAHVPHYLAQSDFPQAAAELVRQIARAADLALPVGDLEAAATEITRELTRQVAGSAEITGVVAALERQYDAAMSTGLEDSDLGLLTEAKEVPSAEEIGAELEAFLAERVIDPDDAPDHHDAGEL